MRLGATTTERRVSIIVIGQALEDLPDQEHVELCPLTAEGHFEIALLRERREPLLSLGVIPVMGHT